jgi:hypothetical protein
MPKAVLVVQSDPAPGREDEYNEWYSKTHLGEVCSVPGFTGARRYKLKGTLGPEGVQPADASMPQYLALYELDTDDPERALLEMVTRVNDGRIFMSDAISMEPIPLTVLYEAID